jgi:hypothetical protein
MLIVSAEPDRRPAGMRREHLHCSTPAATCEARLRIEARRVAASLWHMCVVHLLVVLVGRGHGRM